MATHMHREPGPDLISNNLSSSEEKAVEEFTLKANQWRLTEDNASNFGSADFGSDSSFGPLDADRKLSHSSGFHGQAAGEMPHVISKADAVKFLMARKFDVERAWDLYRQHQYVRHSLGLDRLDAHAEPLSSELHSEKFTVWENKDNNGATIAVLTARMHSREKVPHEKERSTTMQAILCQLDAAVSSRDTQRHGLTVVYDMSGLKWGNFDMKMAYQLLEILKGGFPARLKKILVVDAPSWFRVPYQVVRPLISTKMFERLFMVSARQLMEHVPPDSLPVAFGGRYIHNHEKWIETCVYRNSVTEENPTGHPTVLPVPVPWLNKNGEPAVNVADLKRHVGTTKTKPIENGGVSEPHGPEELKAAMTVSVHRKSDRGMGVDQFVKLIRSLGKDGILREYDALRAAARALPDKEFLSFRLAENRMKNRYVDVPCFETSRVKLIHNSSGEDYIHANFVDGYEQKNAFISTQGPMPKTFPDFWLMVWEQECRVLVMTTRTVERGKQKCGQYWPVHSGESMEFGEFVVTTKDVHSHPNFLETALTVKSARDKTEREIVHLQFTDWPDYGVPSSAASMFDFIGIMRNKQEEAVKKMKPVWHGVGTGPPIIIHCSAGIGRSGSLCALDICIRRLDDSGLVDLHQAVQKLRSQRCQAIQMPEQYLFCYLALVEYAVKKGLISPEDADLSSLLPWLQDED